MGLIDKVIPQKELDLEYNSAKIIASPYDYKLSKRLMLRDRYSIVRNFNIFNKRYNTEVYLAAKLDLDIDKDYMGLNPNILINPLPTIKEFADKIYEAENELGMCGSLIEYNNLNVDEETLVQDISFLHAGNTAAAISSIKSKKYLKALEVLHIKGVSKSSLIPSLMYLATEFYDRSLDDIENIRFAEEAISRKENPIMISFRDADDSVAAIPETLMSASMFLIDTSTGIYNVSPLINLNCDEFYRLGLVYALTYGVELLYYFDNITDDTIKNALEELFSVSYKDDTFCSRYLYQINDLGHVDINPAVKACFCDDNELRFESIRRLLNHMLTMPDMNKEIVANYNEFVLPLFFMRMVASMHGYAYQVARVKHATLLYKTAKDAGVIDKNEFNEEASSGGTLFSSDTDDDTDEDCNNELIDLSTFSTSDDSAPSVEESIEKEKSVGKKRRETPPALTSADAIKNDLHNSPYSYDINFVKNDIGCKEPYNLIANNIKLITNELTRQIKEIKTYNTGGKQNGLLVGKLDKKNLWKYKTDPHIFYNNNYKLKEMDLAFGCILDESGSMYGEKIKNGRIVMIMLHEVLNSLGINHGIIGHTSSGMHQTKIFKYYQFKEEAHYSLDKPYGLVKADNRNGNCDSGALYYMQSVLKQVRNKDKIVIIFSDGQPTECTDTELVNQVQAMEKSGIHVIGVGINFESIKEYYPDNANGRNLKEMVNIVVSILKRYVLEKKED